MKIDVLDHGFVRLVDHMGSDLSIVRAARVSFDTDWRTGEDEGKDAKLIGYLMKNRHSTPFEAVTFTFEVKAPIFVLRQWHRHRTWSYNEQSARYTELEADFYVPAPDKIGSQSATNKQGREIAPTKSLYGEPQFPIADRLLDSAAIHDMCVDAFQNYQTLLKDGVPRELARTVLPLATYSRMFATVNLWNLMHFLRLRLDSHAQWEIRVYAEALRDIARSVVPVAMGAFEGVPV